MLINYLNAVTIDIIKKCDFVPIRDRAGNYIINSYQRVFRKLTASDHQYIEILYLDILNEENIKSSFFNNMPFFERIAVTDIYRVFVCVSYPDNAKINAAKELKKHADAKKINLTNIVVDLTNKDVTCYNDSDQECEYESILRDRLNDDLSSFATLGNIKELVEENDSYPTIEEVTQKTPAIYIITAINVFLWLLGLFFVLTSGENIIQNFGIKDTSAIIEGEYWRLFTAMFLHLDFEHLLFNSIMLVILGISIERLFGTKKFLFIYLVSGIMGNIAGFAFSSFNSLGASGAILGLGGALTYVWFVNKRAFIGSRRYIVLLFYTFYAIFMGFANPGVDNLGHIGGFLGGILCAGIVWTEENNKSSTKRRTIFTYILIALASIGILKRFIN